MKEVREKIMLNKVMLIGNIGQKPERINTSTDLVIAKFSIATSEYVKDKEPTTQWHNIKCFRWIAEKALKLDKGTKVYVEGRIKQDKYVDKDGKQRVSFYIQCDNIKVMSKQETIYNNSSNPWGGNPSIQETRPQPELTISDNGYKMPF
jgi:single stranded DNA-binding protein